MVVVLAVVVVGGMMGNGRHYEQVTVKRKGKRRLEGQVKEAFRAWMSRQPYDNVTGCAAKNRQSLRLAT